MVRKAQSVHSRNIKKNSASQSDKPVHAARPAHQASAPTPRRRISDIEATLSPFWAWRATYR